MDWKAPGLVTTVMLEHRARSIRDPIARLRFLKQADSMSSGLRPCLSWVRRHWKTGGTLVIFFVLRIQTASDAVAVPRAAPPLPLASAQDVPPPNVWLVEKSGDYETYSNGLRIERRFEVANVPRRYVVFDRLSYEPLATDWRTAPAGIVFHTTESHLAPFEARQNAALKRLGESVLDYVRRNCSYHYVIDRFGRVFRIVQEADTANHAGKSTWADESGLYVNLNGSFLGVSFEAQTQTGEARSTANKAQIQAARILTELLRSKYHIPAGNCVTHAQVSVNPDNMGIGYHTDWADNFPFPELGLPDNYGRAIPSIYAFGFVYDPSFIKSTGARLWKGLLQAEAQLRQDATASGFEVAEYRAGLQRRYQQTIAILQDRLASDEAPAAAKAAAWSTRNMNRPAKVQRQPPEVQE